MRRYEKVYVGIDQREEVEKLSNQIASTGVKEKDAIHIACAMLSKSDVFLSTDRRLLKYRTDKIRLLNPIEFIANMEECDYE